MSTIPESPDLWLAEALRTGAADREQVFRRAFDDFYRPVCAFFSRRGFPPEECGDLAQETFLRVHQYLATFRGEASLKNWIFEIAANLGRNKLRSQAAKKRDAQEVPLDAARAETGEPAGSEARLAALDPGALEGILKEERTRILRQALEELPAKMRHCVFLRLDQELRYREIAVILNVSVDTVKAHLFQARQQLKGKLAAYFESSELRGRGET